MIAHNAKESVKEAIGNLLKREFLWDLARASWKGLVIAALTFSFGFCLKATAERLRQLRLEADAKALADHDAANQIENAPQKVRSLPQDHPANEPIKIDSY